MKRILAIALLVVMGSVAIAAAQCTPTAKAATPAKAAPAGTPAAKEAAAAPTTLTGEVVDLSCYMGHGAKGMDHAKCATSCITKGQPVGFLTTDGTLYVILGQNHETANSKVVTFAGKKSTITGTVKDENGLKAIELASIAEAK
jgi:hypothetical protein